MTESLKNQFLATGCHVTVAEPMRLHTTFRIGGPAQLFVEPENIAGVAAVCRLCHAQNIACHVLGNGSNLLVADEGVSGVMLSLGSRLSAIRREGNDLIAQSGATLTQVCRFAQREGLAGLEFAFGIPGSVGGAAYMNAGAYGGEIGNVVTRVDALDADNTLQSLEAAVLGFGYRTSLFQQGGWVVVGVRFSLMPDDPAAIDERMHNIMSRRLAKQPLDLPSAGSTFKRPEGAYAAVLIEQCGLKGFAVGGAEISRKHAGFIVNTGRATCADVLALCHIVQQRVLAQTGFALEME
ncbi:MAG: UDP-N-acetylmuramate dehydrogenase, partial [Oscillospiraceae bacterium]